MAEAFGVAAGALTVIELSAKVISRCKHLIETTRDAPKDLRHILIEVSSLKATLESLRFLSETESDVSETLCTTTELKGTMSHCRQTVEDLSSELDKLSIAQSARDGLGKRQMLKGSLSWCLQESKARKLLEATMQQRATISLALLGDVARDVKDLKRGVRTIQDNLTETKLREICTWLEKANPTGSQNAAAKVRDENTCRWILRQQEWLDWLAGTGRAIWIHGIPGAGKTILASFINEHVESRCATESDRVIHVYFYFSYRTTGDQTVAFLGWFLGQLSRRLEHVPSEIQLLHNRSVTPKSTDLTRAIKLAMDGFDLIYLVIDAVDECNSRDELLHILSVFLTDEGFAKVRLLATSRDYADIRAALEPLSTRLSMSNPVVREDILAYIKHELRTNSKLSRWPLSLRTEIAQSLVEGANGMFRWAACQLTCLEKKRTESCIRGALKQLPETLDETYLRILREIPKDDWPYARRALMWICVHEMLYLPTGVPNNCLISAVFSDADSPMIDFGTLHEICGCLIKTTTVRYRHGDTERGFDATHLAHYTVKEFLFSERLSASDLSYFSLSEHDASVEYLNTILQTCMTLDLSKAPDCYFHESFPAYCREAARVAPYEFENLFVKDEGLWRLYLSFLNTPRFPLDRSLEFDEDDQIGGLHRRFLCWDRVPQPCIEQQTLLLLSMMEKDLLMMATRLIGTLDLECILTTPFMLLAPQGGYVTTHFMEAIGIASVYYGPWVTDFIFDIMSEKIPPHTALMLSIAGHVHGAHLYDDVGACRLYPHLRDGANPNGPGCRLTPLQLAVSRWDYAGVDMLLKTGATPNHVGNPVGRDFAHIDSGKGLWSALHIIRNSEFCLGHIACLLHQEDRKPFVSARHRDRARIEQLLIQHGAEDFIVTERS